MTALPTRRPTLLPLLAVAGAVVLALATQLAGTLPAAGPTGMDEPLLDAPLSDEDADALAAGAVDPAVELGRARDDVTFWAGALTSFAPCGVAPLG